MNTPRILLWALICGIGVTCHPLQAQQNLGFSYGESGLGMAIPDNDPSGIARSFEISGLMVGVPYDLTVRLSVEEPTTATTMPIFFMKLLPVRSFVWRC